MLNTLPYEYEQDGGEGRTAWRGPVEGMKSLGETHSDCPYSKLLPGWLLRNSPALSQQTGRKKSRQRAGSWEQQ